MKRRTDPFLAIAGFFLLSLVVVFLGSLTVFRPRAAAASPAAVSFFLTKIGEGTVEVQGGAVPGTLPGEYVVNDDATAISLLAVPAVNWEFGGWSSADIVISQGMELSIDIEAEALTGGETVTATFVRCYLLNHSVLPTQNAGTVDVIFDPHPICEPPNYVKDSEITLTMEPNAGFDFLNWKEADVVLGQSESLNLTMDGNKTITANFEAGCRKLVRQVGLGNEIVGNDPPTGSPDLSAGCSPYHYKLGQVINLEAHPADGWDVLGWKNTIPAGSAMLTFPGVEAGDTYTVTVDYFQKPTFNFATATEQNPDPYKVEENVPGGVKTITVVRTGKLDEEVSVDYLIEDGTAEYGNGKDYTFEKEGPLVFGVGVDKQTFDIIINDDSKKEPGGPETILLELLDPSESAVLGSYIEETLSIYDDEDDPALRFDFDNLEVSEGDGTIPIDVTLFPTSEDLVAVKVRINEQSASAGVDYNGTIQPVNVITFFEGESTKTIYVTVNEDQLSEGDELFELELYEADGADLGQWSKATVTIKDNDPLPEVRFSQAQYFAMVGDSTAELTVLLSAAAGRDVTVDYTITNPGGGIQQESSIVIPAGDVTGVIDVDILGAADKDEYTIELSDPANALLGSPNETSLFVLTTSPEDCNPLTFSFSGSGLPPAPTNLDRSLGCAQGSYLPGEIIGVTAQPATGWYLAQWQGTNNDNAKSNENVVIMPDEPHEVKASYLTRVFLAVIKNFGFFPSTNEVEPNNTFAQANGPIKFDEEYHGAFESPEDKNDRFFFILDEASDVQMTLTDIPAGRDYDLFLYDENWADGQINESIQNGNLPEMIDTELPAGKYYLRIIPGSSTPSTAKYTLKVVLQ